ncbi:MAG: ATP-binding cassette domain-containing protein [Paludibacteraceae bacterium]|nr:ATP-binding cassette domain-containing protein [Paludibacteraceae bacterium]
MINVKNVHKRFDGHVVLDNISVDMHDGQCNMIIGQSGSGKTVLMKSIIGLHTIDSGRIEYDGRNLPDMTEKEVRLLRREVGMLFQGAALFDSQSVLENVMFPLEMWASMTRKEMEERAKFCLGRVNIQDVAWNLSPAEISGGMQKRVAIARAISMNPKYLFCDEPNSGLDPKTSLVIDQLIHEITEEFNICTVINSHDMNSIMEIGDNIVFLKEGVMRWNGSRHEIFDAESRDLQDFVFASELFKKVRAAHKSERPAD